MGPLISRAQWDRVASYVPDDAPVGVPLGATVRVQVREKQLAARVVKPPFVRNGKALV